MSTRFQRVPGPPLGAGTYGTVKKYVSLLASSISYLKLPIVCRLLGLEPARQRQLVRAYIVGGFSMQMDMEAGGFVAIKKARCGAKGIPASVFAEIKALQELRHPNVVQVRLLAWLHFHTNQAQPCSYFACFCYISMCFMFSACGRCCFTYWEAVHRA